jgi:dihydroorotate dehydrogenase (fumarate)
VLRYVAEIAQLTEKPIVGIGGVMNAEDAVEMLMAGASAVGICTAPILRGTGFITKLKDNFSNLAEELGYDSPAQITRAALGNLYPAEVTEKISFSFDPNLCTACNRCVQVCPYGARTMPEDRTMELDEELCRCCGLCVTVCNPEALTIKEE